jgi:hypothetical protein
MRPLSPGVFPGLTPRVSSRADADARMCKAAKFVQSHPHLLHKYAKDVQKIFAAIYNTLYTLAILYGMFIAKTKMFRPPRTY